MATHRPKLSRYLESSLVVLSLILIASLLAPSFPSAFADAAGQPADEDESAVLESTPWSLVEYTGPAGATRTVLPDTEITANFQDGRVDGSAGCNSYGAVYGVNGSEIRIGATAVTPRACETPPGIMDQELAYLAALRRVSSFEATPDKLALYADDGSTLLTFVPQAQTPLEGTTWNVLDYNNGRGAVASVMAGTLLTAHFDGGSIEGFAGCNNYRATYMLNGNNIAISPQATTRLFCTSPAGIMDQEAEYLAALERADSYRIEGDRLFLETAEGTRAASFTAADETAVPDARREVVQELTAKTA